MAWPFKKKKDMIDLTYLAKRGLVNVPETKKEEVNPMGDNPLGFLGAIAGTGKETAGISVLGDEKPGIKNKIDDFEFKLDNLIRKVDGMVDRLDLVEKKISRNERVGS